MLAPGLRQKRQDQLQRDGNNDFNDRGQVRAVVEISPPAICRLNGQALVTRAPDQEDGITG